jgi:pre-mRNA-splicing factor CWC22
MSSVDFEECCHKLLKLNIREGQEMELCTMILECCTQERTYLRFYGLLAQRFCLLNPELYAPKFLDLFIKTYHNVHKMEVNKLRNGAKFFGHLLHTEALQWGCLSEIHLTEGETTSSSRIFIKILVQELAENLGLEGLARKLASLQGGELDGVFPRDSLQNARFSINFFTSIGLGAVTEGLREFLKEAPKLLLEKKYAELLAQANAESSSSDEDSSSSSSSSSGSERKKKKHRKK